MKILTKEEEAAHYNATLKGGAIGGALGLGIGSAGILLANRRFPAFRSLTPQLKAFLATSSATFTLIIGADRASRNYELHRNAQRLAYSQHVSEADRLEATKPFATRAKDWAGDNRYSIVCAGWLASMGVALALVRRNPYLSTGQKLVQSRVYAQGLTLAVLLASFGLEARDVAQSKGRWETVKVLDPEDPMHQRMIEKKVHHERYEGEDQWMEVIAAEEKREKERQLRHKKEMATAQEAVERAHNKKHPQ
ncbi:hypothetical protein BT63DRAFT_411698 [Microthyrium microscopicum]|uniref:HIG1 domain-containing protein n=1 Tax=Microthyrium microscopicum TaxID=703497 RepID=A0A6A6ULU9_9PEZI|nr:hypothetical protein BT63DRAFT_411698 [Microthyrium microscopicum]